MIASLAGRFFYHIYPLGMCGAPPRNDFTSPAGDGLRRLIERIPHLTSLGVGALYIGPVFESTAHGYDTLDYFHVDRRLGTNADLTRLVRALHDAGIKVVLDAVLNHTGRHFFAFRDLQEKGERSAYRDWFVNVDFRGHSPSGDGLSYEGWSGHYDLVKLNTGHPAVVEHLLSAVKFWIEEFDIDGLRLDAADVLAPDFMDSLASFTAGVKPDFWLMGEVVHGDYRNWARQGRLHSVTNYEAYKGLWSSLNDRNMFEIAWSLNRQFGSEGIYRHLNLYTFVDNHDVPRAASVLRNQAHLHLLYGLLFTIPGLPALYYGSEWGLRGEKRNGSDAELRPAVTDTIDQGRRSGIPAECRPTVDPATLENAIRTFASIRSRHPSLAAGSYRQIMVKAEQLVFLREGSGEKILVAVNSAESAVELSVEEGLIREHGNNPHWRDLLDNGSEYGIRHGFLSFPVSPNALRILMAVESRG